VGIGLIIIGGIVVVCTALLGYIAWFERKGMREFPIPGRRFKVKGTELHIQVSGKDEGPTVVFDHGSTSGSFSGIWRLVAEPVGEFTRVVTYDRAGYGWSDPGNRPRTAMACVEELHELLQAAEIPGPYIYVGHSYGGLNARLYAGKYPWELGGVVLVDAIHEDELTDCFPHEHVSDQKRGRQFPIMLALLARFGLLLYFAKKRRPTSYRLLVERFLEKDWPLMWRVKSLTKTVKAVAEEFACLEREFQMVRKAWFPSKLPLTVIVAGKPEELNRYAPHVAERIRLAFLKSAERMKELSAAGKVVVAQNSGHHVHVDHPEIVVGEIIEMIQKVRDRSGNQ
jgi:pimeloyl-ACP methyl ester carboxylesterase